MKFKKIIILFCLSFVNFIFSQQNTILWQISSPNSSYKSFILGTNHLVQYDSIKYKKILQNFFANTSTLITELDNIKQRKAIDSIMLNRPNNNLVDAIGKNYYENLKNDNILENPNYIDKYKLSELYLKLLKSYQIKKCNISSIKSKSENPYNIEDFATTYFNKNKQEIIELENLKEQLSFIENIFKNYSNKDLIDSIKKYIDILNRQKSEKCNYINDFFNGKFTYDFTRNYGAGESDAKNRNLKWLDIITSNLNKKNIFIIVGIDHLDTKDGLLELLKAKGYTINPVELKINDNKDFGLNHVIKNNNMPSNLQNSNLNFKFDSFKNINRIYRDNFTGQLKFQNGFDRTIIYSNYIK